MNVYEVFFAEWQSKTFKKEVAEQQGVPQGKDKDWWEAHHRPPAELRIPANSAKEASVIAVKAYRKHHGLANSVTVIPTKVEPVRYKVGDKA